MRAVRRAIDDIVEAELVLGIREVSKPADFRIASAAWAWADEAPFERLERFTSAAPGDLVRCFRMAVQLLRECADALPPRDPLRRRLRGAITRLYRGEVDAERQLLAAAEL
jgi:superfamily II RNA helicase